MDSHLAIQASEINRFPNVPKPLDPDEMSGTVKCAKVRHLSVECINEIIGQASPFFVNEIRGAVADLVRAPPLAPSKSGRKRRRE